MTTRRVNEFLGAVGGRAVNVAGLSTTAQARLRTAGADAQALRRAADLDGDGVLRGETELRAAFRYADQFDRDGNAQSVLARDAQGAATTAGVVLEVLEAAATAAPAVAPTTREAAYERFLAQARREGSNGNHLSFLDRGLASSPFRADASRVAERFARRTDGLTLAAAPARGAAAFPARGERVTSEQPLPFLGTRCTQASVAVLTDEGGVMRSRWYGRDAQTPAPMWSASKSVNALALITRLNTLAPGERVAALRVQEAGRPETAIGLGALFQDIASYDAGVPRSNAGAGLLGRLLGNAGRDGFVTSQTGDAVELHGNYGGGTIFNRPEVVTAAGQRVLLSPEAPGPAGRNRVSAVTLTRLHAQAALHTRLAPEQRLAGAQAHSLAAWTGAMAEDSARYTNTTLEALGLVGVVRDVAISTKLGFGYVPETGKYECAYSGVLQFTDPRENPAQQRTMSFTLRGEDRDPVALDASMAADMTELVRRLISGEL